MRGSPVGPVGAMSLAPPVRSSCKVNVAPDPPPTSGSGALKSGRATTKQHRPLRVNPRLSFQLLGRACDIAGRGSTRRRAKFQPQGLIGEPIFHPAVIRPIPCRHEPP